MTHDARPRGDTSGPARPRKPTPAERRAERAEVDDPAQVLEAGARFLEARHRSVAEVRRKLMRLGYRPDLVTAVIERLGELGYLDDDAFARAWVESRDRAKPRGEHALRRELGLKGVDRSLVDAVLDDRREDAVAAAGATDDPVSADEAAAERLLARKLPAIRREADPRRRLQRAYGLLARNGFGPDVCASVSKRLLAEGDDLTDEG
jgi:regulatory protein